MDSSLPELWQSAANGAFLPAIGKSAQFYVAFILLLIGVALTAVFALSMFFCYFIGLGPSLMTTRQTDQPPAFPSSESQLRPSLRTSSHEPLASASVS